MNILGNIGITELLVIFLLALIVLGPERLPEMSRKLGTLVRDLRRMYTNLSRDLGPELSSLPTALQEVRDTAEALRSLPRDAIRSLSQATSLDLDAKTLLEPEATAREPGRSIGGPIAAEQHEGPSAPAAEATVLADPDGSVVALDGDAGVEERLDV